MIFSNKVSKFGKGKNVSAYMPENNKINIYFYNSGILKKSVTISSYSYSLTSVTCNMPYNAVIEIADNSYVTRLDKSIGITINE